MTDDVGPRAGVSTEDAQAPPDVRGTMSLPTLTAMVVGNTVGAGASGWSREGPPSDRTERGTA